MMCLSWSQRSMCAAPAERCPSLLLFMIGLGLALFPGKKGGRK
jgi:hypothetical protein